jgi:hypothetical protein
MESLFLLPDIQNTLNNDHVVDFGSSSQPLESWTDDWGDDFNKKSHNGQTRPSKEKDSVEDDINFFVDMEPDNVRQARVYVGANRNNDHRGRSDRNRLSVSTSEDVPAEAVRILFYPRAKL